MTTTPEHDLTPGQVPVDPLAHVKVGDSDPCYGDGDDSCTAECDCGDGVYWVCTRPEGHPGQHFAAGYPDGQDDDPSVRGTVLAVWPAVAW